MKYKKLTISIVLFIFAFFVPSAFAENSGTCGDNLTWTLAEDGTLTISGTGEMYDYEIVDNLSPWGTEVKSVVIEPGVTSIGWAAFCNCSLLENVSIPSTVTHINTAAFLRCISLADIVIPEGVTSIGTNAFGYCSGLKHISLPASLMNIAEDETTEYSPENHVYGMFNSNTGLTSAGPTGSNCSIEYAWTESIPARAFANCTSLTSVILPVSLARIEENAFVGCSGIVDIEIPQSVISIGNGAFNSCSSLTKVELPQSLTSLGKGAFNMCASLSEISFKGDMPDIQGKEYGNYTFYRVTATVDYPANNATYTSENMLNYGGKLTWVPVETLNVISSGNCGDNLTWTLTDDGVLTISGTGPMYDYNIYVYDDSDHTVPWQQLKEYIKSVVVEEGVTSIGDFAFNNCIALEAVELPDSLTKIGCYSFEKANLKELTIPKQITKGNHEMPGGTGLCVYAFSCNKSLASVRFMSAMTTISEGTFTDCKSITDVYYPGTKTSTGAIQFSMWNSYLSAATWHCADGDIVGIGPLSGKCGANLAWQIEPDGTLFIAGTGYMDDYTLVSGAPWESRKGQIKRLFIEDGVLSVGSYAFDDAHCLSEVSLPESLESIGDYSFYACVLLKSMYFHCKSPAVTPFEDNPSPYPFGRCDNLTNDFFWGTEAEASSILNYLPETAVRHYIGSDTLSLPASLIRIEAEAFSGTKAQKIVIPATINSIESRAFAYSESVQIVRFEGYACGLEDDILAGNKHVIIECFRGSPIEEWACRLGYHVEYHH